jgi:hypothetical protein
MENDFFAYVRHLEMLAFFSGYPLIFYLARFVFHSTSLKYGRGAKFVTILPYSYALVGTLYLGLILKNLYPNYTFENVQHRIQQPYLVVWGILSILFWIPVFARKQILSILHSLVFFCFILRDLFFQIAGFSHDSNIIKNDMSMYTVSIFLNLFAFAMLALVYFLPPFSNKHYNS